MSESPIRVDRATDDERFLATDTVRVVRRAASCRRPRQLVGVPAGPALRRRPPAADPGTYPGIYGVRPMQLAVPAGGGGAPGADGRPDLGRRPPRPPPARGAHRDAAPPRRADPPRGRRDLRAARERAGASTAGTATACRPSRSRSRSAAAPTFTAPGLDDAASALDHPARDVTDDGSPTAGGVRERGGAEGARLGRRRAVLLHGDLRDATPSALRDKEPRRFLFATRDGVDVGLAAFRRDAQVGAGNPAGTLEVAALIGEPAPGSRCCGGSSTST